MDQGCHECKREELAQHTIVQMSRLLRYMTMTYMVHAVGTTDLFNG